MHRHAYRSAHKLPRLVVLGETQPLSPGAYLTLRREAAGLGLMQAASSLAACPWAIGRPGMLAVRQARRRLQSAEDNVQHLTLPRAEALASVIPLDPRVYEQLVDLHLAGPGSGLPVPQVCQLCACSWFDPCHDAHGQVCAWASPDLCTSCADKAPPPRDLRAELAGMGEAA